MPRINNPKPPKRAPKIDTRRGAKKKPCSFCQHGVGTVDYKDLAQLRKYISDRGKIRGRKVSGNCQQHQRDVTDAIKTARELALLPYTQRTVTERRGGRGGRDGGRDDRGRGPRADRDRDGDATTTSDAVSDDEVMALVGAPEGVDATEEESE
ncbi:MAG: 30S ribosomal protein S18 [Acidobacteriota bacterium]|nr:30S ribosomal protein S18 [Acidobacteriota bacterium]MDE3043661.1 30S ribosomal protein S18 [Acidobacteriota bacterium]MDE3106875.1 30S ribosomal protein S18 [Acidobacteriota bacterium]MDE3222145.1 30S ribosomal protein S18 [Acidobacteriota bacterium]